MNTRQLFPIGKSDFAAIREGNYHYVDKSLFILDLVQSSAEVLLLPRPRRFGKTLNLSMLRYFFEKSQEERSSLFSGLLIEQEPQAWTHFQKYPTIFLTFKDVKTNSWEESVIKLKELLSELFTAHSVIQQKLAPQEQEYFHNILFRKASATELSSSLLFLSKHLANYHQEKVVILIDEYDTCLHEAYAHGYEEQALSFFRNFLSGAFKDNSYVFKGVITGILRIARESLFSGLNNLTVYSLLQPEFATSFGFTENEVDKLVKQIGLSKLLPNMKAWYNGYVFGEVHRIYNPFSIVRFLDSQNKKFQAYWVNTSSNQLIKELLFNSPLPIREELEVLLQGGTIEKPIYENTVFSDLKKPTDALWSFLLFCGYLTAEATYKKDYQLYGTLRLVNQESYEAFFMLIQSWFQEQIGYALSIQTLLKGLLTGQAEVVEKALGELLKLMVSYHDVPSEAQKPAPTLSEKAHPATGKKDPESVYHMFTLGLLANLISEYQVKSNPESGYGRADVLLIPRQTGKPGVTIEFKVAQKGEKLETALQKAKKQLKEKQYDTELKERGASPIYQYAAAFSGKHVLVQLLSRPNVS